jgi:hypothetical protein
MAQVITNGLAAGQSIDAVINQTLDAGADPSALEKAAIALNLDLSLIFKALDDKCSADTKLAGTCTPCTLMKCAVEAGVDPVTAANAMMAARAQLEVVRQYLASLGYAGADSYS